MPFADEPIVLPGPAPEPSPEAGEVAAWLTIASSPDARAAWWASSAPSCTGPHTLVWQLKRRGIPLREPTSAELSRCLDWLARPGTRLVGWGQPHYPEALAALVDAPAVLFVEGSVEVLSMPQIAIVGSRKPTPAGAEHAFRMARELAEAGVTVTSGLALGIDAAAHRGALSSGIDGRTVGVPGSGPDIPYPRQHAGLYADVARAGVIASEFPPGMAARPHHFPRRNRIISGLSRAVVVVEAGLPSGTLITARHALAQGREVLAVPGSVANAQARGCHALIRDGARLVEDAGQVLEELEALRLPLRSGAPEHDGSTAPTRGSKVNNPENSTLSLPLMPGTNASGLAARVLDALGADPGDIDSVVRRSGLTVSEVSSILASLELSGRVWAGPAGTFQRKPD